MRCLTLLFCVLCCACDRPASSQSATAPNEPTQEQAAAQATAGVDSRANAPQIPPREPIGESEQSHDAPAEQIASDAPADESLPPDLGHRKAGIDWPDFLGPNRDSKSPETGILTDWPTAGPKIVWFRPLGTSYGIGSISRGRYFQLDRYGDNVRLSCLQSETGKELWKFEYPTSYEDLLGYNNGPRCTPVVDGDRVYIFGAEGMLHCLSVADGSLVWKIDTAEKYGVVQNFFGVGSTPIVEGDNLIVLVGGSPPGSPPMYSGRVTGNGTGIVAFDKRTGEEKYRLTDELASYSCPVVATIDERRWCFVFARGGLVGFEPASGKFGFHYPWRARILESVNAATPVVFDDKVFITETYGPGSSLLKIVGNDAEVVWRDSEREREKAMQAHWNTPIYHEGYLYGSSGRHKENAELRCIDATDGKVMWSEPGLTRSSLLYVDGHLVCLSEDGAVRLLKANPKKYDLVAGTILHEPGGNRPLLTYPAWAAPVLSHGLLYLRGESHLVCLELIPQKN